jgi:phosphatidylserine/phosphatidylglycerophosphate/cardiolipin synthase-like enzyme
MKGFEDAAQQAASRLAPQRLRKLAAKIAAQHSDEAVLAGLGDAPTVSTLLAAARAEAVPPEIAAAYLRGVADGYQHGVEQQRVQVVWSGPTTHDVPTRSTAQVLTELIGRSERELILVTYSAKPYPPIRDALASAIPRGVAISVVVETLQGAGSALSGPEPAAAFATLPAIQLWHWPKDQREHPGAKMHAKIAVADRRELFTSSVNLTESGVQNSIESGVLIRGGTAPQRAAEHILALQAQGVLRRL